jgi:demethylspheroidene O-methyltransferase
MAMITDHPPQSAGAGLRARLVERWYVWRDRKLRSPEFQRFAAAFPLTRPEARKRAAALFDLVSGFVYSQVLFAVVRLRLLERIADEPRTLDDLMRHCGMDREATERLLAAAIALRLVNHRTGARFGLGDLGAALLANPGVIAMVEHHALFYRDLDDPVALLRGEPRDTNLSRYWAYATHGKPGELAEDRVADYSRLMAVSQSFIAAEILDAYPVHRHARVVDVGGGEGAFIMAAAERAPDTHFTVVDLPAVAFRARQKFQASALSGQLDAVGADMFNAALPEGADLMTLIRVLYDHDRAKVLTLLKAVHRALPKNGTLLVSEPMRGTPGAESMGDAYFGFYLTAMRSGKVRSADEISALLREAGFSETRPLATRNPLLTSIVLARP